MKREIWFPIFLLVGFIFLIVYGLMTLSMRSMRFPLFIGGIGAVLALVEIFIAMIERRRGSSSETRGGDLKRLLSHLPGLAMLVLIVPLIWLLGFLVAVPLHVFIFLRFNGEKWVHSFVAAVVTGFIFYFVIYLGMRIPFEEGLLFSYLHD
jgi:hypothetical protein